jgi:hypothetical protein
MPKNRILGLGRTRFERNQRLARRMWKFYIRHNWWQFAWVGLSMHESVERATA